MELEYNSRALLSVLFKQKMKFVFIFSIIMLIGLCVIIGRDRVFEARGSFLVKFGQGAKPDISVDGNERPNELAVNDRKEIMQSYIRIILSKDVLTGLVQSIGVDKIYPELSQEGEKGDHAIEEAVLRLQKGDLLASSDDKSNIIEIFVRNQTPEVSAVIVDKLMARFLQREMEIYNTPQTDFLQQQIGEIKQKLEATQEKFLEFKRKLNISDIDTEMNQLLQEKREIANISFEGVNVAQAALAELEAKAAEMQATYKADSPVMRKMQESIDAAHKQLAQRQADFDTAANPESSISIRASQINDRIVFLEEQRGEYNELKQQVEMYEENYKYYQQRGEEARVNNVLNNENITRISIMDAPSIPVKPLPMRRAIILLAFLMLATFFGLVAVIFSEIMDETFSSPEQLSRALEAPVLVTFDLNKNGVQS